MGWKEDWQEKNRQKRAQKEAVADVTYRAYQQEREAQGFPSSSVSKGNDIISAVRNGISSLTQPKKEFTWNMKTARQRLLELELPRENWYSGEKPTTSEALAQIWRIGQTDKEKASRLYDSFQQFKNDPTTAFYDPYSQATNRKIADITKYGIDVSGGINEDWFKKNAYLMNYYTYGSTNNPLGTAKSRSKEQNAAALYYDLLQDEEKTKKAETEWQALQDEVRYWTGRKDLNLTDQEILNRIDWNNYKTLSSMDESRENGAPIALNRAIGYSRDNLYGIIWEERNGQKNGNIANDAVKYRLGAGNRYEEDADIRRQNDPNSEYFSPYYNGIPMYNNDMNDTALYFGVNQFDKDWLEKNRNILYGNDETAIKQYQRVAAAEENTLKAEAELQTLHERIDYMIDHKITNPDTIMSMLGLGDEDTEYSTLAKMDQSLKNGKWVDTTRAIPYSYNDIKREVEQRCAEEENKKKNFPKALDHTFNTGHENGAVVNEVTIDGETTRNAVDDVKNQNIKDSAVMVTDIGTPGEQKVYQTAGDVNYDKTVADINDKVTNGAVPAQTAVDVAVENANQYAGENYVGAITTVKQYEQDAQTLNTLKQQLEELKQKWGIGGSSSKVDMSKVVGTSGSSGGKLNANGATGSKNFGKGNIDLTKRIPVMNEDGTISTVDSFSVGMDIDGQQKEVLLPTIIDGKRVSEEEAIQHYEETGEYLGIFDTVEEANEYAEQLHKDQEEMFERDFKKFEDENYDAMAEAWSQSADEDEYRQHMFEYYLRQKTGGDYAQYGEDAQTVIELERQIAELEQKQQEGQEGYEQAKYTVKNVYEQYGIQADISELTDTQAKNTIIRELDVLAPIMATYTPTQYSASSIFDAILEGGYSKQEAAAYARQTLDQCRKDLDTLNHAVETAGPYIWITDNQQKQNIEREQARLERAIQEAQDFLLRDEGDFNKTAAKGMEKAKEALYDKNGKPVHGLFSLGNDGYSELDRAVLDPEWTKEVPDSKYYLSVQMSDAERATYFYIREKQGEEAAKEYYDRLADDTYGALQVRQSEETAKQNKELAEKYPLLMNAAKIIAAPGKAAAGLYSFYNLMTGQDVNPYSAYYAVNNMGNTVAQTTHEKLDDAFGEGTTGAKIAGFLYDALSSAAESSMTAILTGGISLGSEQAATFLGKFGLKAAESFLAATPMSIGAMGDTIQQALADGATPEQALLKGAASFLSETISEGISIGNITDAFDKGLSDPKSFVDFIKSVAKSSFEEGSEEIVSGIFEDWTDQMIMGEMSKRAQMVKEYQSTVNPLTGKLYTEEEAKQLASRDVFEDVLMQGLSGAVSGGAGVIGGYVGGTVTNAANKAVNNAEFRRQFKSGGKFIDNMVKETDAKVQAAETNYQQAEDAALKAREAANDTNLTAEEQQIAATEADRLDQEAANAKAELETAQQESEKATVDRDKWNALREGALQFHNDYQSMQQAEAAAQEAKGTKNETQRRKDADKAKEKYEKSKSEFKKQYSDMAESGIAEQLGITAEDLEADPVEVAEAVFEAENVTETAQESTEAPAEEVTAPNAEQAAIERKQPLTQEERERALQKVEQLEAEARQAEEEATAAIERASEARKTAQTENTEEARNAASIAQQEADQAQARAFEARKQANKAAQADAILQASEGNTPQPRQNRFGIAVNEAEAQRAVNDMTVLTEATGYGQSDQTAAVAAVLNDNSFGTMASTAAQNLMQEYGSEKVLNGIRKILNTAVNRAGVVLSDVKNAIITAAMNPQGEAHDMLGRMLANDLTTDGIRNLVAAAQQESSDPNVQASMIQQDHENRVDQRTKQLLAQNDQGELKNAEATIEEARNSVAVAQSQYDAAMAEFQETGRRVQELNAQWVYDTNNKDLGGQLINAIKEHEGADNNVRNLESNLEAAKQKLQKAKEDFAEVEKRVMQAVREQALAEVTAEDTAAAQQMAEQQAAAEVERENTRQQQNIDRLADEAFIDQIAPDATPEERELIRQRINEQRQQRQNGNVQTDTTVQPENRMNDFIDKLSKRFGVNIEVRDTTNGGTSLRYNGSYDESTNTITIDQGATQSDVMLDVALHELTHMAERSGLYDRLATALTRIAYQNADGTFDENRLANDIRARQQMYNARLAMMQQADPTVDATPLTAEEASKEVVADLTRRILYGDEAAINSLVAADQSVAQRILNGIKSFLKRLAGINDPAVTQLEQTRKLFEKALKEAGQNIAEERTQYSFSDAALNSKYMDAVDRGDMDAAQSIVDEAAREAGYTIHAFHGTSRADRVGTEFRPERATSGPMAFFTDSKEIAENYAKDKKDTSIAYEDEYQDYYTQFRVPKPDGGTMPVQDMWYSLPLSKRQSITDAAKHITMDDDGNIVVDNDTNTGLGNFDSYTLREHRNNSIEALIQSWLEDGNLWNREGDFMQVLEMVGIDGVQYFDPDANHQGVYDTYLNIQTPFDTTTMYTNEFVDGLEDWWAKQDQSKYEKESMGADLWDKNNVSIDEWIKEARREIKDGTTHNWTRIPDAVTDYLKSQGHDGIKDQGGKGGGAGHTVWIPFTGEQVKESAPVTYDDAGNVIPVSERFNKKNRDIRYSLPSANILDEQIRRYLNGEYDNLPAPMSQLPTQTAPRPTGQRQRQFGSQTAQRSNALHDEVKDYLFTHSGYDPDTNQAQIDRAIDWARDHGSTNDPDGYHAAVAEVLDPNFNFASADGQARMLTVLSMAALKNDTATEAALADAYNRQGTVLGRALQARTIFSLMTPIGRRESLRRMENRLNESLREEGKDEVHLSKETLDLAEAASTTEDFMQLRKQAKQELAAQMPSDWKGKLRTFRYFAMLFNPVTHIRNILGNAAFMPAVAAKNAIGAALESKYVNEGERTKTVGISKELKQFAKQDAVAYKDELTGEGKYNASDEIERERKYFSGFMQKAIDINSNLLEAEDWIFLKRHYANALAGWMQANNYTAEDLQNDRALLDKGRAYAKQEAQKATYRDASKFATALNNLEKSSKVAGFIVDAAIPFKKTPANILKRGLEYSPVGLLKTAIIDSRKLAKYNEWVDNGGKGDMPKKAITPTQFIDRMASGLTGTGVAALGALMSAMGWVRVGFDDDDEIEKQNGAQQYSLELFGHDVSYTIDWLAPMCMPFFVGATLYEEAVRKHDSEDPMDVAVSLADSMLKISEPIFNLSMLDGVNSLFNTQSYSDTGNNITDIGTTLASNYITSFVPTALGKVAKVADTTRRETYVPSGTKKTEKVIQQTWQKVLNKLPGATYLLKPYVSPLGEEEKTGTVQAILQNFLSPGYFKDIDISDMEKELDRLAEATGELSVVPKQPAKYFQAGGEQLNMDAKQYTQYQKSRGTKLKNLLNTVVSSPEYKAYGDDARVKMINDAVTYCTQIAKAEISPDANVDKWVREAQKSGNVMASLVKRREDKAVEEYQTDHKDNLIKAIDEDDMDTAYADILALQESKAAQNPGRSRKQINSDIRKSLDTHYQPIYQEAIEKGDKDTAFEIQLQLMNLGIGYTASTFTKWRKGQD